MTKRLRVFVLYEHGEDFQSWCSGHLRLLRPLAHPRVADRIELHAGRRFDGGRYDVVIVERLWRSGITLAAAEELIAQIAASGAKLVYAIDDNLLDIRQGLPHETWFKAMHEQILARFAAAAVGMIVSTEPLRARFQRLNPKIAVLPNALDERLLASREPEPRNRHKKIIGYMGTPNHDEDLELVLPALREVCARQPVEFQLLGVVRRPRTLEILRGLPWRTVGPTGGEADYPLFMLWYTSQIRWDIGIAPLGRNAYTECKSDIKVLDYAAIGAVGVYAPLAPYEKLRDGAIGLVARDQDPASWTEALTSLLTDDDRRADMRARGRAYLFGERTLERMVHLWPETLERLIA